MTRKTVKSVLKQYAAKVADKYATKYVSDVTCAVYAHGIGYKLIAPLSKKTVSATVNADGVVTVACQATCTRAMC